MILFATLTLGLILILGSFCLDKPELYVFCIASGYIVFIIGIVGDRICEELKKLREKQ